MTVTQVETDVNYNAATGQTTTTTVTRDITRWAITYDLAGKVRQLLVDAQALKTAEDAIIAQCDAYLAIASPTNAQVVAFTKQSAAAHKRQAQDIEGITTRVVAIARLVGGLVAGLEDLLLDNAGT